MCSDIKLKKLTILKIDVVGFEFMILNGAKDLVQNQLKPLC
jgi:hypothetical protein